MAKVLNTHEQADFERLAAFYPYRDEHGLPVLEESLKDYAKRTNQAVNTVKRQADRGSIPINQDEKNCKRLTRTVLIFTESSDQLSRATDRVPGLPASPG
ncbi:hypothetical protein MP879_09705, partial [Escherichia coli]